MNYKIKKYALILGVFSAFIFFHNNAFAMGQPTDDATLPLGSWSTEQTFTNYDGLIRTTTFKVDIGEVNISDDICENSRIVDITDGYASSFVVSSCESLHIQDALWTISWDTPNYVYDSARDYTFSLATANVTDVVYWRGTSSTSFPDGQEWNSIGPLSTGCTFYISGSIWHCTNTDLADLYFTVNDSNFISFSEITDGGTYSDFSYWTVDFMSTSTNPIVKINYSRQSDPDTIFTDTRAWAIPLTNTGFQILKSQALWFPPLTYNSQWYAQAFLYLSDGSTIIASTTQIGFTVNGAETVTYSPSSTTSYGNVSTTLDFDYDTITCSEDVGFWGGLGCNLRKAGIWILQAIFVPSKLTTNFMSNTFGEFKTVFPFSIFFKVTDTALSAIGTEETPQSVIYTLETPRLNSISGSTIYSSSTDSITFSNANTLSDILGEDLITMLFNAILLVAIIAMIIIVYKKFIHH